MELQKVLTQGQPAQSAQADLSQKFLPLVNFLHVTGSVYRMIQTAVRQTGCYGSKIM